MSTPSSLRAFTTAAALAAGASCAPVAAGTNAAQQAPSSPTAALADGLDPEISLVDIATQGEGEWQRYRIPALTVAPNGDLLAVYDGRPTMQDLPSNIALLLRRSTDGGRTWHEPEVIRSAAPPHGFGDPSILVDRVTGDVFVFHAASIDAGFASSTTGSDPADPNVLHADVSVSADNGLTWTHRRITAQLKAGHPDWAGIFAASGEGIQLRQEPYAGRLIQQYVVRRNGQNYAVSAWSDDHGATWRTSEPVGPGADENKTVELSDGRIMLNSRASPHRLVAISEDGGATYTALTPDPALPDPGNNGSILRAFPNAAPGDPRARMLIFSNTANRNVRRNLTVRLSCDDGATWPVSRVVQSGASAYSTLTPLRSADGELGGRYGLLYEREGYRHISFTSFDLAWLGGGCDQAGGGAGGESPAGTTAETADLGDASLHPGPALELRPVLDAIHPNDPAGLLGDRIQPWVEVLNTGSVTLSDIAITSPTASGVCTLASLAPGETAVCRNNTPSRIVTESDLAAGSWEPIFHGTARAGEATVEASAPLFPVELIEPTSGDSAEAFVWVPTGSFASSALARVPRVGAEGAPLREGSSLELLVPRNSRTSAQLTLTALDGTRDLRVAIGALTTATGTRLPGSSAQVRFPEYIPDLEAGGVVADPLREVASVDVARGHNLPIWITVRVPAEAPPGLYRGDLVVSSAAGALGSFVLQVSVPAVAFRDVADRPFVLDLWVHPDAVADHLGLEPWSDAHFAALKPYWADLAAAGQRVINLAISEDPWLVDHRGSIRPQTESPYRSTVDWRWDGERFTFGFEVFDRLVSEALAAGIGPDIHVFGLLQFQGRDRITYTDTRTGEWVSEETTVGSRRHLEAWTSFLAAFEAHLRQNGWLDHTRLAFDEQPLERMNAAFAVLRAASPAWLDRIALAANSLGEADIAEAISFNFSFLDRVPQELIDRRRSAGKPTLFYTWAEPTAPNTITATPLYNVRALPWVVARRSLDGYLRWTYNSWPADVYRHPKFRYAQGDEYLVYPGDTGPVSSIRWEVFRDGQEDVELLDLARLRLGAAAPVVTEALVAVDPTALGTPESWAALLAHRARLIEALAGEGVR